MNGLASAHISGQVTQVTPKVATGGTRYLDLKILVVRANGDKFFNDKFTVRLVGVMLDRLSQVRKGSLISVWGELQTQHIDGLREVWLRATSGEIVLEAPEGFGNSA